MDDFGDVPAAAGGDPASEFLEREKEELGDVLGTDDFVAVQSPAADPAVEELAAAEVPAAPEAAPMATDMGLLSSGMDGMRVSPRTVSPVMTMPRIEPETIRVWRAENEKRLAEKDAKEEEMLTQLREQAKKELSDW